MGIGRTVEHRMRWNGAHDDSGPGEPPRASVAEPREPGPDHPLGETGGSRADVLPLVTAELRAPAAILLRQVRRLQRAPEYALSPAARRAIAAVEEQARRVAAVADVLLELDALERGDTHLHAHPVQLGSLLARIVDARADGCREHGVDLRYAPPAEPVTVSADSTRLVRAVNALVDDALATAPRGGHVAVSLHASAQGARITVEWTEAALHRRRAPAARERISGVGRAVARRLAEMHGGSLEVERHDRLLTVHLALPPSPPVTEQRHGAPPATGKERLLVVDDDHDAREALSLMLGDDYDVLLAADGREALERAIVERPDLVLMDLYMPRMDGLASLEAMRADPATQDVPVILISARGDDLTRSRSLDLGAVDFLQKPFSGRELKARIERTLRFTRRETELQTLARTDPLTGLANLRAFRARLDEEVKRARRYHTPLACVMVDMDRLKPINDAMGHAAGDAAIRALAEVIRRELRETDFGARYGGDEFVLLLPHTAGAEARVFAERVCARLRASPAILRGREVPLAASFGIASLDDETAEDAGEALVRRADGALYAAKRAGRGRVAADPSADGDEAWTVA